MKKRLLGIFLTVCMALTLLPAPALAAINETMIGTVELVIGKYYSVLPDGSLGSPQDSAPLAPYILYTGTGVDRALTIEGNVVLKQRLYTPAAGFDLEFKGSGDLTIDMTGKTKPAIEIEAGNVAVGAQTFDGSLSFTGGSSMPAIRGGDIHGITLSVGGSITVASGGAGINAIETDDGHVYLLAGGRLDINGGISASGEVKLYSDDGDININGTVRADDDVTIFATAGNININDTVGGGVRVGIGDRIDVSASAGFVRLNGRAAPEYFSACVYQGDVTSTGLKLPVPAASPAPDKYYFDAGAGYIVYDSLGEDEHVLTLNNATIDVAGEDAANGPYIVNAIDAEMKINVNLRVILQGESNVLAGEDSNGFICKAGERTKLTFSGNGSLRTTGGYAALVILLSNEEYYESAPLPEDLFVLEGALQILEPEGAWFATSFSNDNAAGTIIPQGETGINIEPFNSCTSVLIGVPPSAGGGESYFYYTIEATATEGGGIAPAGKVRVQEGSDKTFTVTPDSGYVLQDLLVDGVSAGAQPSYTFKDVQAKHTIHAVFAPDPALAAVPQTGGGSAPLPFAFLALAALCGMGAVVYRKKRT